MPVVIVVVEISVQRGGCASNNIHVVTKSLGPALLFPRKSFIEERQHFRNIKLNIFEIEIFLSVLLHLEQVVKLEIQLQQTTSTPWFPRQYLNS